MSIFMLKLYFLFCKINIHVEVKNVQYNFLVSILNTESIFRPGSFLSQVITNVKFLTYNEGVNKNLQKNNQIVICVNPLSVKHVIDAKMTKN